MIRFTPLVGNEWIGNLQSGWGYATKVIEWPKANAVVVIANGATYFIRPDHPADWRYIDVAGIDCTVAPTGDVAVLATYTDVVAITVEGTERWRRSVAVDGVQITTIESGLIRGNAGIDPPDEWRPFVLQLETGADAEQSDEREPE